MLNTDPRGYRVALVADSLVETTSIADVCQALDFGIIVPPPDDFGLASIGSVVEYLVDDLLDYRSKDYVVVVVGDSTRPQAGVWLDEVTAQCATRGVPPFEFLDASGPTSADAAAVGASAGGIEEALRRSAGLTAPASDPAVPTGCPPAATG